MTIEEKIQSIDAENAEIEKDSKSEDIIAQAINRYKYVAYLSNYPPLSKMEINLEFESGLINAMKNLALEKDKEAKEFYKFLDKWSDEIQEASDMFRKHDSVENAVRAYIKMNPSKKYTELDFV